MKSTPKWLSPNEFKFKVKRYFCSIDIVRTTMFSSVPWSIALSGGHEGWFSRDPLASLFCRRSLWAVLAWAGLSSLWCCPSSISSAKPWHHPPSKVPWRTFQGGYHGVWQAWTMQFLFLDSCQKRFLWTHREVDHILHPVVGLVLQVGDADKFLQAIFDLFIVLSVR